MLQLLSATAVAQNTYNGWTDVTLGGMPLHRIYSTYSSVILRVYDTINDQNGFIDLYQLPIVTRSTPQTLNNYLAIAAGLTITLAEEDLIKGKKYVPFYYATAWDYRLKGFNNLFHPDTELLPDQKVDVLLYHPKVTDYRRLQNNALFTVNGLIHRSDISDVGVVLYQGGRTITRFNDNRVGVLDFSTIGEFEILPIEDNMIKAVSPEIGFNDVVYFDLPVSLEGKTIFIVLGGVLHALDNVLDVVGSNRVKINFKHHNLLDQFYNTYKVLDLSSLPLTRDVNVEDQFVTAEFSQDEFIRAFLKLSQTFFVVIDATGISVQRKKLNYTDQPGIYRHFEEQQPDLPVQIGTGFISEYNIKEQDGFWVLSLPHGTTNNYVWKTTTAVDEVGVNYSLIRDQRESYYPRAAASAYLLYIVKE